MTTIVTRAGKGSALTHNEVDTNFTNLNSAKYESGNNATFGTIGATTITGTSFSTSGNLTFTGTSNRITGDFSNGTVANRVAFQTSTTNGATALGVIPNGTSNYAEFSVNSDSSYTNSSTLSAIVDGSTASLKAAVRGTGTYLPMTFFTGGSERMRIDTSGNVGIGTSSPSAPLTLKARASDNLSLRVLQSSNNAGTIQFTNDPVTAEWASLTATSTYLSTNTAGYLSFGTNGTTERMRIDSSGNVGIGTNSGTGGAVNAKLDVLSNITAGQTLSMQKWSWNDSTSSTSWGLKLDQIHTGSAINYSFRIRNGSSTDIEALYLQSSGNVGIGTSSPSSKLTVGANPPISGAIAAVGSSGGISLALSDNVNSSLYVRNAVGGAILGTDGSGILRFATNGNTSSEERMRIDASGNVLVGTTSSLARFVVVASSNSTYSAQIRSDTSGDVAQAALLITKADNNSTTSQVFQRFAINVGGTANGQINANGASQVAFGSWSDARLKENIVDLPSQLNNITSLRPVEFDYKDGSGHQVGFIAQEMQEVYPDAVGENSDGYLTITGWDKTTSRLVKAIQELSAKVNTLQAELNTLKGN